MNIEKLIAEKKYYYVFYDKIAKCYGEPFSARNNAEALRAFFISMKQQKQKGMIVNEDDYLLYKVCSFITYENGYLEVLPCVEEVVDNEENNKE